MRRTALLLVSAATASCTAAPPAPPSAAAQAQLQQLIAGRTAERPITCLPHYNADDMVVIDENTIAFRSGGRIYVAHMQGPCSGLGGSGRALVTRNTGGLGLCSGDIAQVVDTSARITVGSCAFGEFVPYVRPG